MAPPLEILADLQLAVDGEDIDIQADGERIVVDLPSLRAGRRVLEAEPLSGDSRGRATRQVREALQVAGFTLEVRLNGAPMAIIGADASPGRLGRLLRLEGVEVRAAPPLRDAARRRPVATALIVGGLSLILGWLVTRLLRS
ncbi:MAG: hypothetical protein ABEL97_04485 [Salinibacter sp.]